jgi:hypothetical protein
MNNDKKILITILVFVLLYTVVIAIIANSGPSTIKEKAELLYESGYELDYEAIDRFAEAWDDYIEKLAEEQEYYEDRRYEDRF